MTRIRVYELGLVVPIVGGAVVICAGVSPRAGFAQATGKAAGSALQDIRRKQPLGPPDVPAPTNPAPQAPAAAGNQDTLTGGPVEGDDHKGVYVFHNWKYKR